MKCPYCNHPNTSVNDSRSVNQDNSIKRRRECSKCHQRFTTYENIFKETLIVIKKSGYLEAFEYDKMVRSIEAAINKNSIHKGKVVTIAKKVYLNLENMNNESTINSDMIGKYILKELYQMDEVASIRYASAYFNFNKTEDFMKFIHKLLNKTL